MLQPAEGMPPARVGLKVEPSLKQNCPSKLASSLRGCSLVFSLGGSKALKTTEAPHARARFLCQLAVRSVLIKGPGPGSAQWHRSLF